MMARCMATMDEIDCATMGSSVPADRVSFTVLFPDSSHYQGPSLGSRRVHDVQTRYQPGSPASACCAARHLREVAGFSRRPSRLHAPRLPRAWPGGGD